MTDVDLEFERRVRGGRVTHCPASEGAAPIRHRAFCRPLGSFTAAPRSASPSRRQAWRCRDLLRRALLVAQDYMTAGLEPGEEGIEE